MKRILSILQAAICLSLISLFLHGCTSKSEKLNETNVRAAPTLIGFSFVLHSIYVKDEKDVMLLDIFEPGVKITLLEKNRSKVCRTVTLKQDEVATMTYVTIEFTRLAPSPECGPKTNYSVATYREDVEDYKVINLKKVADKEKIKALDEIVRKTTVLQNLQDKAQGLVKGDINEISRIFTQVYRYPILDSEIYIVSYKLPSKKQGPRVLVIDNKPYPLTGWCSYPYVRAFRLNYQYYIESGSFCCGCGITAQEVFMIRPDGPVREHGDSSLSD